MGWVQKGNIVYPIFAFDEDEKDESFPNVVLLEGDDELKTTAEYRNGYLWVADWEKYEHDGEFYWFQRSGYSMDVSFIEKLNALVQSATSQLAR